MNEPPTTHILLPHEALFGFACTCLKAVGVPSAHAELVSRLLVESDLRGVRSHGTRQVNRYCLELQQGGLNPDPQVTHLSDHGAVVALDGDGGLGYLPMVRATEIAIERAGQFGLGLTTVRNIGHYGAAGNYCRRCTEAGCIGFSVQGVEGLGNAGGQIPKPQLAFFGNPPICFAFPGREGPGVVLDAATRILGDDQLGPEFAALVPQIPGAFFRSVGLTAVAELLGAGLAGAMLRPATARQCWPAAVWGGMVMAIQIEAAVDEDAFRAEVDRLGRDVGATYEPFPGQQRALLPGALEAERRVSYSRDGVPFGPAEQEEIRQVSERLGVPVPWQG